MAELITHAVCVDCTMWVANRDDSSASDEWKAWRDILTEAPAGDERAAWARYVIAYGWVDIDVDLGFSWSRCELCDSRYGGDRHRVCVMEPKDDQWMR